MTGQVETFPRRRPPILPGFSLRVVQRLGQDRRTAFDAPLLRRQWSDRFDGLRLEIPGDHGTLRQVTMTFVLGLDDGVGALVRRNRLASRAGSALRGRHGVHRSGQVEVLGRIFVQVIPSQTTVETAVDFNSTKLYATIMTAIIGYRNPDHLNKSLSEHKSFLLNIKS